MNILLTGAFGCTEESLRRIGCMGHKCILMPDEAGALPCEPHNVDGVICNGLFLHHPIERFDRLKYIQLTSAGLDRVPLDYIKKHGIELHNARGVYSIPMAESAVCGVLQLYRQSAFFRGCQRRHSWEKRRDLEELYGKTVCIVGCGSVGAECAKRFSAFGCRIIGVARTAACRAGFDRCMPIAELRSALEESDIVVLTLPVSDETRHLIGGELLAHIRDGGILVNICRGAVVNTDDLLKELESKRLRAVLDVFEEEPLGSGSPMWDMENVIITPHNSFAGELNAERLEKLVFDNLEHYK